MEFWFQNKITQLEQEVEKSYKLAAFRLVSLKYYSDDVAVSPGFLPDL